MEASVKIMLSYDYSHFEIALSSDNCDSADAVDELRKVAQRLADKAVKQYKTMKMVLSKNENSIYTKERFIEDVHRIDKNPNRKER
jgi:hypothetical protein